MLKWILFLLSEYYFEIFRENSAEILANIKKKAPWVEVELRKAGRSFGAGAYLGRGDTADYGFAGGGESIS